MSQSTFPRRFGQVIRLRKGCVDEYKACHAKAWPEVLRQIKDSKIEDCKFIKERKPKNYGINPFQDAPPLPVPRLGHVQFTDVAYDMDSAYANFVWLWRFHMV